MMESRPLPKNLRHSLEYVHNFAQPAKCRWPKSLEIWMRKSKCGVTRGVPCWCCMMHDAVFFLMPVALFRAKKYTSTCRKHVNSAAVWQVDQLSHHVTDCRYLRWVRDYWVCCCTEKLISSYVSTFNMSELVTFSKLFIHWSKQWTLALVLHPCRSDGVVGGETFWKEKWVPLWDDGEGWPPVSHWGRMSQGFPETVVTVLVLHWRFGVPKFVTLFQ